MVIDSSAILSVLLLEKTAMEMVDAMKVAKNIMSTVNFFETLIIAETRIGAPPDEVRTLLSEFNIEIVAPDEACAIVAAQARGRYPLNFGDCFAYALAKMRNAPLLTLDADFSRTDVKLVRKRR